MNDTLTQKHAIMNTKTLQFKILLQDGNMIDHTTVIRRKGERVYINTPLEICRLIKNDWMKVTNSKSFTDWANCLNDSGEYEGVFTKFDALDNLASNYTLNIDNKHVNLYEYFTVNMPFKH